MQLIGVSAFAAHTNKKFIYILNLKFKIVRIDLCWMPQQRFSHDMAQILKLFWVSENGLSVSEGIGSGQN